MHSHKTASRLQVYRTESRHEFLDRDLPRTWADVLSPGKTPIIEATNGDTRLHALVSYAYVSDEAVAEAAASSASTINAQNSRGWTALHSASASCYYEGVRCLIQAGADMLAKTGDESKQTPAHLAVRSGAGSPDILQLLLSHGDTAGAAQAIKASIVHDSHISDSPLATEPDARGASPLLLAASRCQLPGQDGDDAVSCLRILLRSVEGMLDLIEIDSNEGVQMVLQALVGAAWHHGKDSAGGLADTQPSGRDGTASGSASAVGSASGGGACVMSALHLVALAGRTDAVESILGAMDRVVLAGRGDTKARARIAAGVLGLKGALHGGASPIELAQGMNKTHGASRVDSTDGDGASSPSSAAGAGDLLRRWSQRWRHLARADSGAQHDVALAAYPTASGAASVNESTTLALALARCTALQRQLDDAERRAAAAEARAAEAEARLQRVQAVTGTAAHSSIVAQHDSSASPPGQDSSALHSALLPSQPAVPMLSAEEEPSPRMWVRCLAPVSADSIDTRAASGGEHAPGEYTHPYFWCPETNESSWEPPVGAAVVGYHEWALMEQQGEDEEEHYKDLVGKYASVDGKGRVESRGELTASHPSRGRARHQYEQQLEPGHAATAESKPQFEPLIANDAVRGGISAAETPAAPAPGPLAPKETPVGMPKRHAEIWSRFFQNALSGATAGGLASQRGSRSGARSAAVVVEQAAAEARRALSAGDTQALRRVFAEGHLPAASSVTAKPGNGSAAGASSRGGAKRYATLLHAAAWKGSLHCLAVLLEDLTGELDLDTRDAKGNSPLIVACAGAARFGTGSSSSSSMPGKPESSGTGGETPTERYHLECVRLLLQTAADPLHTNSVGDTALHVAAAGGAVEACHLLLEYGGEQARLARGELGDTPRERALAWIPSMAPHTAERCAAAARLIQRWQPLVRPKQRSTAHSSSPAADTNGRPRAAAGGTRGPTAKAAVPPQSTSLRGVRAPAGEVQPPSLPSPSHRQGRESKRRGQGQGQRGAGDGQALDTPARGRGASASDWSGSPAPPNGDVRDRISSDSDDASDTAMQPSVMGSRRPPHLSQLGGNPAELHTQQALQPLINPQNQQASEVAALSQSTTAGTAARQREPQSTGTIKALEGEPAPEASVPYAAGFTAPRIHTARDLAQGDAPGEQDGTGPPTASSISPGDVLGDTVGGVEPGSILFPTGDGTNANAGVQFGGSQSGMLARDLLPIGATQAEARRAGEQHGGGLFAGGDKLAFGSPAESLRFAGGNGAAVPTEALETPARGLRASDRPAGSPTGLGAASGGKRSGGPFKSPARMSPTGGRATQVDMFAMYSPQREHVAGYGKGGTSLELSHKP